MSLTERQKAWRRANHAKRKNDPGYRKIRQQSRRKLRGLPEPTRSMPAGCEICGGQSKGRDELSLDHDHVTGKFRGWLCNQCNLGLGCFKDSSDLLVAAARYIREHQL